MNSFLSESGDGRLSAARGPVGTACHGGGIRRLVQWYLHGWRFVSQLLSGPCVQLIGLINKHLYEAGPAPMGRLILWKPLGIQVFCAGFTCYFLNFLLRLSKVFRCINVSILLRPVLS
jgi:hypothetical protein